MDNNEVEVALRERDRVLRAYILGRTWDRNPEFLHVQRVVRGLPELAVFPYLFDYEWEIDPGHPNLGSGDLILADGNGRYAVVEVKHIDERTGRSARTARTQRRGHVLRQAEEYARAFTLVTRDALEVHAVAVVGDEQTRIVGMFARPAVGAPWVWQPHSTGP